MQREALLLVLIGCVAPSLAVAQDRGTETPRAGADATAQAAVAQPHKALSPIGRAMAELLRAAAQTPTASLAQGGGAADPKARPAVSDAGTAHKPPPPADQVAVH